MNKQELSANYVLTQIVLPIYIKKLGDFIAGTIMPNPDNMRKFISEDMAAIVYKKIKQPNPKPILVSLSHYKTKTDINIVFIQFEESFVLLPGDAIGVALASVGKEEVKYFTYEKGTTIDSNETAFVCGLRGENKGGNIHTNYGQTKSGVRMQLFAGRVVEILTGNRE